MTATTKEISNPFEWTEFYMKFADKLLEYKNNRKELLELVKKAFDNTEMRYPFVEKDGLMEDICPFTVFGCFNKGITQINRYTVIKELANKLDVRLKIPHEFTGVPILNNIMAWFFRYKDDRELDDIDNLWDLLEASIKYADEESEQKKNNFIQSYNKVSNQSGIKWNITMGLFWIRPYKFLNLDQVNRSYILKKNNQYFENIKNITKLRKVPNATDYLKIISICKDAFKDDTSLFHNFPELSQQAWGESTRGKTNNEENYLDNDNQEILEKRYWIYAPGENSTKWDEFYAKGIMGIGWNDMGNLKQYPSKEAMKEKMKQLYGVEFSYRNSAHATWQFANELKVGDIVYAKKGLHKLIGRGIVESDYIFDESRNEYRHIHKIKWTHNTEKEHPGQAVLKTLTDITPYTEYVKKLEILYMDEIILDNIEQEREIAYEIYTDEDFLSEVFMDEEKYLDLVNLIKFKKNIILQGAPGVGKTFAAKRLAYSVMGEKDKSRVMMIQFHQSYSYEDFIMGFRPKEEGFELVAGPFYEFCKKAQEDDERDYFFIIDEINRGNLSKILGELLMLIEKDKRNEKLRLLYVNELFSVPQNLYIIGMMNTADRGLAMIDYALRRRFAFFEMEPAFDSEGFQKMRIVANNEKFDKLVDDIKELNTMIRKDESLGDGFRIGHSYLCTNKLVEDDFIASVVKYEILPLVNEYWFDEPSKIEQWTKKLRGVLDD